MVELLNTLYVSTPGTSLHLDGDAVRIYQPDQKGRRLLPLSRIDHVVVYGGVTVTDDLLKRCAADHRSVTWLSRSGRFLARVSGPQNGPATFRLAQYQAYLDPERRLALARTMIAAKLQNTRQMLLRAARDATGARQIALRATANVHADAITQLPAASTLATVMGVEGNAARRYVASWPHLLTNRCQIPVARHRASRPAMDPINAAFSFGYALLRVTVQGALEQVGLDPYLGFMHGHRAGKPALALDMMEAYRALLVDRTVITAFNQQQLTAADFETTPGGAVRLTASGRVTFISLWSIARARPWHHPTLNTTTPAALLPLLDARILVRHLRGDVSSFAPWTAT